MFLGKQNANTDLQYKNKTFATKTIRRFTFGIPLSFILGLFLSNYSFAVPYSATLTTSGDVELVTLSGNTVIDKSDINVITNCKAGYNLTLNTSVDNSSLYLNGDSDNNDDDTYLSPGNGLTALRDAPNTWGYYLPSSIAPTIPTNNNVFLPVPDINSPSATLKTTAETASDSSIDDHFSVYYGANIKLGLAAGTYTMKPEDGSTSTITPGRLSYYLTTDMSCANVLDVTFNKNIDGDEYIDDFPTSEDNTLNLQDFTLQLSDKIPERAGYIFQEWNTAVDGNGNTYHPSDILHIGKDEGEFIGAMTLYAIWTETPYLQNWNHCDKLQVGDKITLTDIRDGTEYRIGKLIDDNCWMLDNLAIDLTDETVQANLNHKTTNATNTGLHYLINGSGNRYTTYASSPVSTDWVNTQNDYGIGYDPLIYVRDKDTVPQGADPIAAEALSGNWKTGGLYNTCATSAGTNCFGDNQQTIIYTAKNLTQDICPTGWRLPDDNGTPDNNSNYELKKVVDLIFNSSTSSDNAGKWQDVRRTMQVPLPGHHYIKGDIVEAKGIYAYFWEATRSGNADQWYLSFGNPSSSYTGITNSYNYAQYGNSVRCIMGSSQYVDVNINLDPGVSSITFENATYGPETVTSSGIVELRRNTEYTITANLKDGHSFDSWISTDIGQIDSSTTNPTTYITPGNDTLAVSTTDVPSHAVTVNMDEHVKSIGIYNADLGTQQVTTNGQIVELKENIEYIITPSFDPNYFTDSWSTTENGTILEPTTNRIIRYQITDDATLSLLSKELGSLQNFTCSSISVGEEVDLVDLRDSRMYKVGKLLDENCWMLDNMAIDLTDPLVQKILSSDNTDASDVSISYLIGQKTRRKENLSEYFPTSPVSTVWSFPSSSSVSYSDPRINISSRDAANQSDPLGEVAKSWKYGVYYNYCAASAGSFCGGYGSSSLVTQTANAEESVCPKGWRIPTGRRMGTTYNAQNEYNILYNHYPNLTDFRNALHLPLSGTAWGTISGQGSYGYSWASSGSLNGSYWDTLYATTSSISTTSDLSRYDGASVRCIYGAPDFYDVSIELDSNLQSITFDSPKYGHQAVTESTTIQLREDAEYIITAIPKHDYRLATWSTDEFGVLGSTTSSSTTFMATSDTSLSTTSEIIPSHELTINFDEHVSSIGLYNIEYGTMQIVHSGDTITLREVPYIISSSYDDGYSTESWSTTEGGTLNNTSLASTIYTITEDATLSLTSKQINSMQAFTKTTCDTLSIGDSLDLYDARDYTNYRIGKLKDGNCWMLDNLALDLTDPSVQANLSHTTTNASDASIDYLLGNNTRSYATDPDGRFATSGVQLSTSYSYSDPRITTSFKDDIYYNDTLNEDAKTWKYGVYYNYCAATAGTHCYGNGMNSRSTTLQDAPKEDICPAGWHIPSGSYNGEYYQLYTNNHYSSPASFREALRMPLASYLTETSIIAAGSNAYQWTSTDSSSSYSYYMRLDNGQAVFGNTNNDYYSLSLRCVLSPETYTVTVNMDPNVQSVGLYNSNYGTQIITNTGDHTVQLHKNTDYIVTASVTPGYKVSSWATTSGGTLEDPTQKSTTYTITDDATLSVTSEISYYMQDFTYKRCSELPLNENLTLYDERDESPYTVARLRDGVCWMTSDLHIGSTTETTRLTSNDTDLSGGTFTLPKVETSSNKTQWGTSNYTSGLNTVHAYQYSNTKYLYNWYTATGGTTYSNSTASYSICPANWKLLSKTQGEDYLRSIGESSNTTNTAVVTDPPLSLTNGYYDSTSNKTVYSNKVYWTSSGWSNSSGYYYGYFFGIGLANNVEYVRTTYGYQKMMGLGVRCVLAAPTHPVTVSIDSNVSKVTFTDSIGKSQYITTSGSTVSLKERTNYTVTAEFGTADYGVNSWSTTANGTLSSTTTNPTTYTITDATVLSLSSREVCNGTPVANTICYDPNGNDVEGTMGYQTISSETSLTLLASNFSRTGYGFAGWNTKADGTGTDYGPQETLKFTAGAYANAGIKLYAKWVPSAGTLQSWGGCKNMQIGDVTALTDQRDNNTYAVAKLADNSCWMIENLRLDAESTRGETNKAAAQGYGESTTYGNFIGLADSENNFSSSTTANSIYYSGTQSGTATINVGTNYNPGYRIPRYNDLNTPTNPQERPQYPNQNTFPQNTTTPGMYSYGNYYNWHAAIANVGDYNSSALTFPIERNTSICPADWRLPIGGDTKLNPDTDFYVLGKALMGQEPDYGNQEGWREYRTVINTDNKTATEAFRSYPNNFLYSGVHYSNVYYRGSKGYYLTATANTYAYGLSMSLSSNSVAPGITNSYTTDGSSIRCIASPIYPVTVSMDTHIDSVTFTDSYNNTQTATTENPTVKLKEGVEYTVTANREYGYQVSSWSTTEYGTFSSTTSNPTTFSTMDAATITVVTDTAGPMQLTYNGNGLTFTNDATTNLVTYDATRTTTYVNSLYSHTANVDDTGAATGTYANNLRTTDIISVPGATSLDVTLYYSTENNYDQVFVIKGSYTGSVSKNMTVTNQLGMYQGGNKNTFADATETSLTVDGDTVTFAFYTDTSATYYGYYAIVTGYDANGDIVQAPVLTYDKTPLSGTYSVPDSQSLHTFLGWSEDQNATTATYTDEADIKQNYHKTNGDIVTLYAIYQKYLTIHFNGNGSTSGSVNDQTIRAGTSANLNSNNFSRTGYTFIGWNTEPDGSGTSFSNNYPLAASANTTLGEELTLYAVWVAQRTVTVTFDEHVSSVGVYSATYGTQQVTTSGGTVILNEGIPYIFSSSFDQGYSINTWSTDANGTLDNSATTATTYTVSGDATLNLSSLSVVSLTTFNVSDCDKMSIGDTTQLYDPRDSTVYRVGKLSDNKCWMLDNLELDITDANVQANLTEDTTNANNTTLNYLKNGGGSTDTESEEYKYAKAGVAKWTSSYSYSNPLVNVTYKNSFVTTFGNNNHRVGFYYNYCAASAGSYCYGDGTSAGTSINDAEEDICPAGWRIPTGGGTSGIIGDYQALYNAYTSDAATNFRNELSTSISGYYYSGSARSLDSYGHFWSTARYSNNYMYDLSVSTSSVTPSNTSYRYYGNSIRCRLRTADEARTMNTTVTFDEHVTAVDIYNSTYGTEHITTSGSAVSLKEGIIYIVSSSYEPHYGVDSWSATNAVLSNTNTATVSFTPKSSSTLALTSKSIGDIQSFTSTECANMNEGDVTYRYDSRDDSTYGIVKTKDHCWTQDNLTLDLTDPDIVNSLSPSNTNASADSLTSLKSGNRQNGGQYAISGLSFSEWTATDHYSNIPFATSNFKNNTTTNDNLGDEANTWKFGTHYNYCAASAGSYCYDYNEKPIVKNAIHDICPAGWRMPTDSEYNLFHFNGYNELGNQYRRTLHLPQSGQFSGGTLHTTDNFFWASGPNDPNDTTHALYVKGSMVVNTITGRTLGHPVRCIARSSIDTHDVTTIINKGVESITFANGTYGTVTATAENPTVSIHYNEPYTITANLQHGATFTNWSTSEGGTINSTNSNPTTYSIINDTALTAKPTLPLKTVTLDLDSHVNSITFSNPEYGTTTVTQADPTTQLRSYTEYTASITFEAGYTLDHWTTDANGTIGDDESKTTTYEITDDTALSALSLESVYIQNYNQCDNLSVGDVVRLVDLRDDKTYRISKLADGKCWTLENLQLDISDPTVKSNLNSTNTNASDATLNYLNNGGGSGRYAKSPTSTTNTIDGTFGGIRLQEMNTRLEHTGGGNGKAGIYYNYCAASAGSYCYYNNAGVDPIIDVDEDICPAGWRLPTSSSNSTSDYQILLDSYNGDISELKTALSLVLSGHYYGISSVSTISNLGTVGNLQSSTYYDQAKMYILQAESGTISTGQVIARSYAIPIRCILKSNS